ncbi:hypothetical protein DF185_13260 [Marinifilum breve]|uniref:Uncharacterized protein n=1 Tax=Marinifilum breve TaxID=2184082 RepID=A0A2V3ZX90_9BACT|nr:hypothetical protein DF185_13260 [Marinifilum breve]
MVNFLTSGLSPWPLVLGNFFSLLGLKSEAIQSPREFCPPDSELPPDLSGGQKKQTPNRNDLGHLIYNNRHYAEHL